MPPYHQQGKHCKPALPERVSVTSSPPDRRATPRHRRTPRNLHPPRRTLASVLFHDLGLSLVDGKAKKFNIQLSLFKKLDKNKRFKLSEADLFPCLNDDTQSTGFDAHYIYHPAWAARIVKEINPVKHIDISSTLHFCSILSAFIPVEFYDYRPAHLNLNNLSSQKADLTNLFFESNSVECLSCMHTIEHIGLGRYGRPYRSRRRLKSYNRT